MKATAWQLAGEKAKKRSKNERDGQFLELAGLMGLTQTNSPALRNNRF